jgi:PAS domain S-box-containing protein
MNDIRNIKTDSEAPLADFFQAITENASDGIVVLNTELKFCYVSHSAYKMFGFKLSDISNVNPNELTHPDDLAYVLPELHKMLENPAYIPILTYRFLKKDGEWLWIESTFSNLFANPSVNGIVINFRDVSERIEHVQKIKLNEERYRLTQEVALIGSWEYYIDEDKYWNSTQLREIFGLDADVQDINQAIVDCIINNEIVTNALNALIYKNIPYEIEFDIIRKNDGLRRTIYSKGQLVDDTITQTKLVRGILRDITNEKNEHEKLKQSQALLEATLKHNRFSVWSVDLNHSLLFANDTFKSDFKNSFGVDLTVGMNVVKVLPEVLRPQWLDRYVRTFSNQSFVEIDEIDFGNHKIFIEVSSTPIVVDRKVIGASFYGENITDRKQSQLSLQEKTESLSANAANLSKLLDAAAQFIKPSKTINYDYITNILREITSSKSVIINVYDGEFSITKSISGIDKIREVTQKYLGFDVLDKKWSRNPQVDKMLLASPINHLDNLTELTKYDFNKNISALIERVFNLGEMILVAIPGNNKIVGNIQFIYEKSARFENSELIEMFSYQLGQYIERTNAEVALLNKMDEMERFHRLTVNRELKMIELKKEINDLLKLAGKEPKYNILG